MKIYKFEREIDGEFFNGVMPARSGEEALAAVQSFGGMLRHEIKPKRVSRDSETGKFVSKEFADAHPRTTQTERIEGGKSS